MPWHQTHRPVSRSGDAGMLQLRSSSHEAAGIEETSTQCKRRGTPAPAKDVHPLVLAELQAVWRATAKRPQPYYVSVDSLGLPLEAERNDTAIMLAGWLTVGGKQAHSVAITPAGLALLKERGMA
jgi:hypothetical protein